jgi:hypothetical protein
LVGGGFPQSTLICQGNGTEVHGTPKKEGLSLSFPFLLRGWSQSQSPNPEKIGKDLRRFPTPKPQGRIPSPQAGLLSKIQEATKEISKVLVPVNETHPQEEEGVTQKKKDDGFWDGIGSEHQDPVRRERMDGEDVLECGGER